MPRRFPDSRRFALALLLVLVSAGQGVLDSPAQSQGGTGNQAEPSFVAYAERRQIPAPQGFEVLDAPRQGGRVVKSVTENAGTLGVMGEVTVEGVTYFISDWSFDRWRLQGIQPNWIRIRGAAAGNRTVAQPAPQPPVPAPSTPSPFQPGIETNPLRIHPAPVPVGDDWYEIAVFTPPPANPLPPSPAVLTLQDQATIPPESLTQGFLPQAVAVSGDGNRLAARFHKNLFVWDLKSGMQFCDLTALDWDDADMGYPSLLRISNMGRYIVSSVNLKNTSQIKIVDLEKQVQLPFLATTLKKARPHDVHFSRDQLFLVALSTIGDDPNQNRESDFQVTLHALADDSTVGSWSLPSLSNFFGPREYDEEQRLRINPDGSFSIQRLKNNRLDPNERRKSIMTSYWTDNQIWNRVQQSHPNWQIEPPLRALKRGGSLNWDLIFNHNKERRDSAHNFFDVHFSDGQIVTVFSDVTQRALQNTDYDRLKENRWRSVVFDVETQTTSLLDNIHVIGRFRDKWIIQDANNQDLWITPGKIVEFRTKGHRFAGLGPFFGRSPSGRWLEIMGAQGKLRLLNLETTSFVQVVDTPIAPRLIAGLPISSSFTSPGLNKYANYLSFNYSPNEDWIWKGALLMNVMTGQVVDMKGEIVHQTQPNEFIVIRNRHGDDEPDYGAGQVWRVSTHGDARMLGDFDLETDPIFYGHQWLVVPSPLRLLRIESMGTGLASVFKMVDTERKTVDTEMKLLDAITGQYATSGSSLPDNGIVSLFSVERGTVDYSLAKNEVIDQGPYRWRHLLTGGGKILEKSWTGRRTRQLFRAFGEKPFVEIEADHPVIALDEKRQWIVTTGSVHDLRNGKLLFSHAVFPDGGFTLADAEGYFTLNQQARSRVAARLGNEVFDLNRFETTHHRPDRIAALVRGDRNLPAADSTGLPAEASSAPTVRFEVTPTGTTRDAEALIAATSAGVPVAAVRLFINGTAVAPDGPPRENAGELWQRFRFQLTHGVNELSAVSVNERGVESLPSTRRVEFAGEQTAARLFVAGVGLNEYRNPRYRLEHCRQDVQALAELLAAQRGGLYQETRVFTLFDEQATRPGLEALLADLARETRPEDVFVFLFAGHGVTLPGQDVGGEDFHLVLHEVTQIFGDEAALRRDGMGGKELRDRLLQLPPRKKLLILDACQSGALAEQFAMRGVAEERALNQLARATGIAMLASSRAEQYAREVPALGHGVFTHVLLEALRGGGDLNRDGSVSVLELIQALNAQVPELSIQHTGATQYPVTTFHGDDFPVVMPPAR